MGRRKKPKYKIATQEPTVNSGVNGLGSTRAKVTPDNPEGLPARHQKFVNEYLIDLDPIRAYKACGYAPAGASAAAYVLMQKPPIKAAIERRRRELMEKLEVTQERVLQELARLGFADIRQVAEWTNEKVTLKPSADIDDDVAAAIASITSGPNGVTVKLSDKQGALEKIGKHLGMFKEKVELSGPDGGAVQIEVREDIQRRLSRIATAKREAGVPRQPESVGDDTPPE